MCDPKDMARYILEDIIPFPTMQLCRFKNLEVDHRYRMFNERLRDCVQRTSIRRGEGGFKIVDENRHGGGGVLEEWMSTF